MSPKQLRGTETVDRLLDGALKVYAEQGEQGVTVSALTGASGVSLGSLYHHFGSVDGLMQALLERWLGRLVHELTAGLDRSRTARDGVRAVVDTYLRFVCEHPDAARFVHSSYADRFAMTQAKRLRDAQEARLSPVAAWVERHTASGELARMPQSLLEALLLGPVVAVVRRQVSGVDDIDLDRAGAELTQRIWRSLEP